MKRDWLFGGVMLALLAGIVEVNAQEIPQPRPVIPQPRQFIPQASPEVPQEIAQPASEVPQEPPQVAQVPSPPPTYAPDTTTPTPTAGSGLEAESLPGELVEDIFQATGGLRYGPTPVSEVRFLMDNLGLSNVLGDSGIRAFGWVEGGYTGASTGSGIVSVEPRLNRFGDNFLLNQIGLVIQKPLRQDQFDLGFNVRYFAGADAALGSRQGGHRLPRGQSALRPGFPRSLFRRTPTDPHRRRSGLQIRPHEHHHRL